VTDFRKEVETVCQLLGQVTDDALLELVDATSLELKHKVFFQEIRTRLLKIGIEIIEYAKSDPFLKTRYGLTRNEELAFEASEKTGRGRLYRFPKPGDDK